MITSSSKVTMQFLFVVCYRRELFQIKSLTWILDHALLVGDSKDTPNKEVLFDLPTIRVRDSRPTRIRV